MIQEDTIQNLLTCYYKNQKPKPGLEVAAENLQKKGAQWGHTNPDERQTYIKELKTIVDIIKNDMNKKDGATKGPVINARSEVEKNLKMAIDLGYRVGEKEVQEALRSFCMALATEGFENKDTTGTQIGQYKGEWPGGGIKS